MWEVNADHLGTPRAITRPADNAVVWKNENTEPFGNSLPNENPSGFGNFEFNQGFPGQYRDKETGTFYNYFRDYDPSTGRYVQSDPIGLDGGLNTYAYVNSNPLALTDPLGLDWGVCCPDGRKPKSSDDDDRVGASQDFSTYYRAMKRLNVKQSDKYFHCMANCKAAQRGPAGYVQSIRLSNFREFTDQLRGDSAADSAADEAANSTGREGGKGAPCADCRDICSPYRPKRGLPPNY